jgi:tetratricopeptide (TPR) repeat protein
MAIASNQTPRHQAGGPDQPEEMHGALEFILKHKNVLTVLAVILIVLILVVNMNNTRRTRMRQESTALVSDAIRSYSQMLTLSDIEQRQSQFDDVTAILDQLENDHGDTPLGNEARFLRGKVFFTMDRYDEAQDQYKTYIEHATNDEDRARGEIALAYSHENQAFFTGDAGEQRDKLDEADGHYSRAMNLSPAPSYIYYYALLGQARIRELTSQNADAIKLYEEVLEGRPDLLPDEDAPDPRNLANSLDYVKWFIRQQQQAESFHTTAKLRLERLRARLDEDELAPASGG